MGVQFEIEVRIGHVYLTCTGGFSMGSLLDAFDRGLDTAEVENLRAVLVDAREVSGIPPTLMQRYDIGTIVPIMQSQHSPRIFLGFIGNVLLVDPHRFSELVALNRGATGRVFTDISKAMSDIDKWIQSH